MSEAAARAAPDGEVVVRVMRRGFSRADWIGDGVVTIALGLTVVLGVFLPWANTSTGHDVNLSPHAAVGVNGALATPWGLPVLALAIVVVVVGLVMVVAAPLRLSVLPCLAVTAAGLGITLVSVTAGWHIWEPLRPGLGMYIDVLGGILLVPTGLASAMVAGILTSPAIMAKVRERTARFAAPVPSSEREEA